MLTLRSILCSSPWRHGLLAATAVASLAGCGQKGDLFLPTEPAAADRATLPQIIVPGGPATAPAPPAQTRDPAGGQGTGTAAPVRQP
jgi:predicted small lipoprotein YifL